ncbi:peptidylprolyl isomerase [Candidatus Woesearchaeota archaeon]|nr:peptidylprolyl isomerase [Candidatus Woesearchaeota archaeon]
MVAILAGIFVIFFANSEDNAEVEAMSNLVVVLETNMGNIEIELYSDKAPISAKNFLDYVNEGFFDGLIFHRVIPGFMVQGGGFDKDMNQKETKEPIKNEADNGLKNEKYTLAMARTQVVDSATSQFFINVAANTFLDNGVRDFGYAVFGKVSVGTDIVDKIEAVETTTKNGHQNVPVEPVIIEKAFVKK